AEIVGLLATHRSRPCLGIAGVPGIVAEQLLGRAIEAARAGPSPTGELPLGLRRPPIARPRQVIGRHFHALLNLRPTRVAHLVFWDALLFAEPAAILGRLEPGDTDDRLLRSVLLQRPLPAGDQVGMVLQKSLKLLDRHLLRAEGKGTGNAPLVQRFL